MIKYNIEFRRGNAGGGNQLRQPYLKNVIKISLDEKPDLPPDPLIIKRYQANRFIFLPQGKITRISGIPKKNKKIINFNLNVKSGDLFKRITNHTMRAGGVLTIGSNRLQAIKLSKKVINNLKFRIR